MKAFLHRKVVDPILKLLKQGISPDKIALCMSVGVVISIFPVIGATTLMCAIAAIILHLNLPAMQIVNYMVYPLQIALLIPFFHFGAILFGVEPLPLSAEDLIAMFRADFWGGDQPTLGNHPACHCRLGPDLPANHGRTVLHSETPYPEDGTNAREEIQGNFRCRTGNRGMSK